jgi:hypothetical protein
MRAVPLKAGVSSFNRSKTYLTRLQTAPRIFNSLCVGSSSYGSSLDRTAITSLSAHCLTNSRRSSDRFQNLREGGGRVFQTKEYSSNAASFHADLQDSMDEVFAKGHDNIIDHKYDSFVEKWLWKCSQNDMSNFMLLSGKKSKTSSFLHLKRHLPAVAVHLESMKELKWRYREICSVIYGLQCLKESDDGYLAVISTASKVIERMSESMTGPTAQGLSMLLLGLQGNKFQSEESIHLLSLLPKVVECCTEPFGDQAVGNTLYGLKGMTSNSADALALISALTLKVRSCNTSLYGQAVGNALYGLQGMSSHHVEVLNLLSALTPKVESGEWTMKPQEVSNALYGMRKMNSDHPQVLSMLSALESKLRRSWKRFNSQELSCSLYGLQGMTSDHKEVLSMLSALAAVVRSSNAELEPRHLSNALYGLQGMTSDHQEVLSVLAALEPKVRNCMNRFTAHDIGSAMYGLKGMTSDHKEVQLMLRALEKKLLNCCGLDNQAICCVLLGMQSMSNMEREVRRFLATLVHVMKDHNDSFDARAISSALYGLQSMRSNDRNVLALISALTLKVRSCNTSLYGQAVGNALYGLQGMSSHHVEVLNLLSALTPKVESGEWTMKPQEVSNALYGMHTMNSDHPQVLSMLSALESKVRSCEEPFLPKDVANALYGLQGMTSDHKEVLSMLSALAAKVQSCAESFSPKNVNYALYGLQGMTSDHQEVLSVLAALEPKVLSRTGPLSVQRATIALYGLQGMLAASSVQSILRSIPTSPEVLSGDPSSVRSFGRSIALILPALRLTQNKEEVERWEAMDGLIRRHLKQLPKEPHAFVRPEERLAYSAVMVAMAKERVLVSTSEFLFDIFESDIVVRVFKSNESERASECHSRNLTINIEIDGEQHKEATNVRFCALRDAYLQSRGVVICRVSASWVRETSDIDLQQWMASSIESAANGRAVAEGIS